MSTVSILILAKVLRIQRIVFLCSRIPVDEPVYRHQFAVDSDQHSGNFLLGSLIQMGVEVVSVVYSVKVVGGIFRRRP